MKITTFKVIGQLIFGFNFCWIHFHSVEILKINMFKSLARYSAFERIIMLRHNPSHHSLSSFAVFCDDGQFRCNSGECITASLVCDRKNDCKDWSDEGNCTFGKCVLIGRSRPLSSLFQSEKKNRDGNTGPPSKRKEVPTNELHSNNVINYIY